jgi:hypothetical protein
MLLRLDAHRDSDVRLDEIRHSDASHHLVERLR